MKKLSLWIKIRQCFCWHTLTTPFQQRGFADQEQINKIGVWKAWVADNQMFCSKCGHVPQVTLDFIEDCENIDKEDKTDAQKLSKAFMNSITRRPII